MSQIGGARRLVVAVSLLCIVLVYSAVAAAEAELTLRSQDEEIMQDGVVVGELTLANVGNGEPYDFAGCFSVMSGCISFRVQRPNGSLKTYANPLHFEMSIPQIIHLAPGEFVTRPICLMKLGDEYVFHEVGRYRIQAVFRGDGEIASNWLELNVRTAGRGHAEYLRSHDFYFMIDSFFNEDWAVKHAVGMAKYEDYERECAKLVLFNLGGGSVIRHLLRDGAMASSERAALGLALANHYGIGREMWEYLSLRVSHPELVRKANGLALPRNEFYF